MEEQQNMHVIEEILGTELPVDKPLFSHYPAMKLGHRAEIDFYAEQLCPGIKKLLDDEQDKEWFLTGPPYLYLPSAANLLTRKIYQTLHDDGYHLEMTEQRMRVRHTSIKDEQEFNNYYNYSKNELSARIEERKREQQMLDLAELTETFKGKSVIIVNDINVTGTQQKAIQATLNECQAKECHWFYIFTIEKALAKAHPEIEYQLNHCQLNDLSSYAAILGSDQTAHTARSVSRLFNLELKDFTTVVSLLDKSMRLHLHQLALSEGRYDGDFFTEKLNLLLDNTESLRAVNE